MKFLIVITPGPRDHSPLVYTERRIPGSVPTHNPLVPGSSPGGPTTSHRNHRVMALRPGDRNPLVHHPIAGAHDSTDVAGVAHSRSPPSESLAGTIAGTKNRSCTVHANIYHSNDAVERRSRSSNHSDRDGNLCPYVHSITHSNHLGDASRVLIFLFSVSSFQTGFSLSSG